MSRRRKEPSEFEKAVWLGVERVLSHEKVERVAGPYRGKKLWTDPSPEVKAARKAIAEFIVRDLEGLEDEPKTWTEKWFHEWTGQWVNVNGSLFDPKRKEWEDYRQKYGTKVSVEDVEGAFPFRHIRKKLESEHRTDLESLVEKELKKRGEDYEFEALFDFYHVDFFLPQRNLIIECDQEYWHSSPEAMARDINKTLYLRKKGYRVARLLFGKEATLEMVKQELHELLDGKKASLQTVLTPPLREGLERRLQEIQQRSGSTILSEVDYLRGLQRLLDEDAGTAPGGQLS